MLSTKQIVHPSTIPNLIAVVPGLFLSSWYLNVCIIKFGHVFRSMEESCCLEGLKRCTHWYLLDPSTQIQRLKFWSSFSKLPKPNLNTLPATSTSDVVVSRTYDVTQLCSITRSSQALKNLSTTRHLQFPTVVHTPTHQDRPGFQCACFDYLLEIKDDMCLRIPVTVGASFPYFC